MAAGAFFTSRRSEGGYKNYLHGNTARSWKTLGNVKAKVMALRGWAMAKRGTPKRQSLTLSPGESRPCGSQRCWKSGLLADRAQTVDVYGTECGVIGPASAGTEHYRY